MTDFTCRSSCTDTHKLTPECQAELDEHQDLCMFSGTTYPGGMCGVEIVPLPMPEPDGLPLLLLGLVFVTRWSKRVRR